MKHKKSICPCISCQDDRNYRSMHPEYKLNYQELKHSRRIVFKQSLKAFFFRS